VKQSYKLFRKQISNLRILQTYFRTFRDYAGKRLYILIFIIATGGVVDGIGLGLFLPTVNYAFGKTGGDKFSQLVNYFMTLVGLPSNLYSVLLLLFLVFLIKGILLYLKVIGTSKINSDLNMKLCKMFAETYSVLDYGYFTKNSIGYYNNLITAEVSRAVGGLIRYCDLISCLIYITVYIFAATLIDFKITLFVLSICAVLLYSFRFLYRRSAKYSISVSDNSALMQSTLIQMLYNFKYLKATDSFKTLLYKINGQITKLTNLTFRLGALNGVLGSIYEPLSVLLMCTLVYYYSGLKGKSFSELMILLLFFYKTFNRVFSIQIAWQKFSGCIGGMHTIENARISFDDNHEKDSTRGRTVPMGDIIFKNVNYSYDEKHVLFDINMVIARNMSIGIVGESGAGKTTFFDLFAGLLDPDSGQITISGIPYEEIGKEELRSRLGYVTQDPVVFNDTVANNISFWSCNSTNKGCIERIKWAAKSAHCYDFIEQLPKGYETVVGDKGVKLSGGQRQRIAIARELYKDPEILIFDEATSSLDTAAEQEVKNSISALKGSRTIIIIAHRISTIKDCDYVYVLSYGRIIEHGSFDELYTKDEGIFRRMCLSQKI